MALLKSVSAGIWAVGCCGLVVAPGGGGGGEDEGGGGGAGNHGAVAAPLERGRAKRGVRSELSVSSGDWQKHGYARSMILGRAPHHLPAAC